MFGILEAIEKIQKFTLAIENADQLYADDLIFDGVLMNFVVIGEMVVKLSEDFQESTANIEWGKIQSLRNIVAHDYFGVDAEEIWQILKNDLVRLEEDIQKIWTP